MIINHPVVGQLKEWQGFFPSKFKAFKNFEVHGLVLVNTPAIEIAMVMAHTPGTGQFREFVRQLKENYSHVRFWAVLNDQLHATLGRYGFVEGFDIDEYGQMIEVMDWSAPPPHDQDRAGATPP